MKPVAYVPPSTTKYVAPAPTTSKKSQPTQAPATPTQAPATPTQAPTQAPTSKPDGGADGSTKKPTTDTGKDDKDGTSTAAPKSQKKVKKVTQEVKLVALDFNKFMNNDKMKESTTATLKTTYLDALPKDQGYTEKHIDITYSAGSVKATVVITPPEGSDESAVDAVKEILTTKKEELGSKIVTAVRADKEVENVLEANKTVEQIGAVMQSADTIMAEPPSFFSNVNETTTGSGVYAAVTDASMRTTLQPVPLILALAAAVAYIA